MTRAKAYLTVCVVMVAATIWSARCETTVSGRQMEGYSGMVVMVMDGKYDMSLPNPFIPSCKSGTIYCNGVYFWKIVLHEDPAEYFRQARRYMLATWGLNVTSMMDDGSLNMRDVYTDPRANHRAYVVPGESVHYRGWQVHNQAFQFTLQRPARLSGSTGNSRIVPSGTSFLYGQYLIQKSTLSQNGKVENSEEYYRLKYESRHAIVPHRDGKAIVLCSVSESPWGSGLATTASFVMSSQAVKENWFIRTMITLDGVHGLGTHTGITS